VFGLKTTAGLVPLDGLVASLRDDYRWTIGPMCRYAEDLMLILKVLIGQKGIRKLKLGNNEEIDFGSVRVFYMNELNTFLAQRPTKEMKSAVYKAVKYLDIRLSCFTQKVDFPIMHHVFDLWAASRYKPEDLPSLKTIIFDFIRLLFDRMNRIDRNFFELALDLLGYFLAPRSEPERQKVLTKTEQLRKQLNTLLSDNGVLIFPAFPNSAPWHHRSNFAVYNLAYTTLFNVLGLPALACPLGLSTNNGMPLGVQIVGAAHSERLICAVAEKLESGFGGWIIPN